MEEILVWAGTALAASAATAATVAALLVWRLRRRNRLHPGVPSAAPVLWLWSPSGPARLHRRLRVATATARYQPPRARRRPGGETEVVQLRHDLVQAAAALDDRLVAAARAPRTVRGQLVAGVACDVRRVERLAGRLATLVSAGDALAAGGGLDRLDERVTALEAARREISELDALLGLAPSPSRDELGA